MGRRSIINKFAVMSAVNSTTSPLSTPSDISAVDFVTYEITIGALVDADLEVYVCNDKTFSVAGSKKLDFGQTTELLGSTETSYIVHVKNMGFRWIYFKVVDGGGSGNVSGWITGTVGGA